MKQNKKYSTIFDNTPAAGRVLLITRDNCSYSRYFYSEPRQIYNLNVLIVLAQKFAPEQY